MKKILLVFFTLSALFSVDSIAQKGFCGMTIEDQIIIKERMMQNRANAALSVQVRTGVMWVPIQFHILEDNNGGNRVDAMKVLDMLCALNEDYLDQDIQFFMKDDFNFIQNSSVNSNPNVGENPFAQPVLSGAKVTGAINIFIVKDIPGDFGQTLGFYLPNFDWLVIRRSEVSTTGVETLTHELGHFFTLPHPFLGWDGQPYDEAVHGNPAPINSPGGVKTENLGVGCNANCTFAGDGFCDTKPNYLFGFSWPNCNFTAVVNDPCGENIGPFVQEENYMAYFTGCASEFTPEQKAAIAADLNSRTDLHTTLDPDITAFTDSPTQNYPIDGEETPLYNVVGFDWEPVGGATSYVVEVDRQPTFSFNPSVKFVSNGTYTEFEDVFDPNKTYYWRVKAIKPGNVCGEVLSTSFKTGTTTGTRNIKEVLNHTISPNPISEGEVLNINIETNEAFDAVVKVYDLSGKIMKEVNTTFNFGTTNHQLSVSDLSEGMYIISIQTENGVLTEKVVVTR